MDLFDISLLREHGVPESLIKCLASFKESAVDSSLLLAKEFYAWTPTANALGVKRRRPDLIPMHLAILEAKGFVVPAQHAASGDNSFPEIFRSAPHQNQNLFLYDQIEEVESGYEFCGFELSRAEKDMLVAGWMKKEAGVGEATLHDNAELWREQCWHQLTRADGIVPSISCEIPTELQDLFRADPFGNIVSFQAEDRSLCGMRVVYLYPRDRGGKGAQGCTNLAAFHWQAAEIKSNRILATIHITEGGYNPLSCGILDSMLGDLWSVRSRLPDQLQGTSAFKSVLSALLCTAWHRGDPKELYHPSKGLLHATPPEKLFEALMAKFHSATALLVAGFHLGMLVGLPHEPATEKASEEEQRGFPMPPPLTMIHSSYNTILDIGRYLNLPALQSLPPFPTSLDLPNAIHSSSSPLKEPIAVEAGPNPEAPIKCMNLGSSAGRPGRRRMKSDAVTSESEGKPEKKESKKTGEGIDDPSAPDGRNVHPALRNPTRGDSSGQSEFDPFPSSGQTFDQLRLERKWTTQSIAYQPPNAPISNFWMPDRDDYQKWRAGGGSVPVQDTRRDTYQAITIDAFTNDLYRYRDINDKYQLHRATGGYVVSKPLGLNSPSCSNHSQAQRCSDTYSGFSREQERQQAFLASRPFGPGEWPGMSIAPPPPPPSPYTLVDVTTGEMSHLPRGPAHHPQLSGRPMQNEPIKDPLIYELFPDPMADLQRFLEFDYNQKMVESEKLRLQREMDWHLQCLEKEKERLIEAQRQTLLEIERKKEIDAAAEAAAQAAASAFRSVSLSRSSVALSPSNGSQSFVRSSLTPELLRSTSILRQSFARQCQESFSAPTMGPPLPPPVPVLMASPTTALNLAAVTPPPPPPPPEPIEHESALHNIVGKLFGGKKNPKPHPSPSTPPSSPPGKMTLMGLSLKQMIMGSPPPPPPPPTPPPHYEQQAVVAEAALIAAIAEEAANDAALEALGGQSKSPFALPPSQFP